MRWRGMHNARSSDGDTAARVTMGQEPGVHLVPWVMALFSYPLVDVAKHVIQRGHDRHLSGIARGPTLHYTTTSKIRNAQTPCSSQT